MYLKFVLYEKAQTLLARRVLSRSGEGSLFSSPGKRPLILSYEGCGLTRPLADSPGAVQVHLDAGRDYQKDASLRTTILNLTLFGTIPTSSALCSRQVCESRLVNSKSVQLLGVHSDHSRIRCLSRPVLGRMSIMPTSSRIGAA